MRLGLLARIGAVAVSGALLIGGCGSTDRGLGMGRPSTADQAEMTAHLVDRAGAARRLQLYRTFDEILPQVSYQIDDQAPVRLTDLVVVGSVRSATEGRGWRPAKDEARSPDGEVVGFEDPTAWSRTVHLQVRVDEVLSSTKPAPREVEVGLAIGGSVDPDVVVRGLREMGQIVLPLTKSSPVFAYDPDLYGIAEDGALLVRVLDSGRLELPFEPDSSADLLRTAPTLDGLRAKAREPEHQLRFTTVGAIPTRVE
jgi:hypothetical protein